MKKRIVIAFGLVLIIAGAVVGCVGLKNYLEEKHAGKVYEDLKVDLDIEPIVELPIAGAEHMENPIDFDTLATQYPDIYAWIRIPGTKVDYPIVQREGDNGYYLNHTIDGKQKTEGSIYTEDYNSKDFEDTNTVIYGHNMKNGSMFKSLHRYKDKQFLLDNSEIYIYQKDRVLKYKIFAAYIYDNRHLMLSFDFEDENIFRNYLNNILTKRDMSSNINTNVDVTVDDKIITLSTCNNNDAQRYLVQAVLISIQE